MSSRLLRRLASRVRISDTERAALEAGDVWADGEFFSGDPDLGRLLAEPYPELTREERDFLDGPVEEACRMVDDRELWRTRALPDAVWSFLRGQGFFGLAIPRVYGGRGFSSLAVSAVVGKLTSRSLALSAVVLIPNSVGPAELLLAYGTERQKSYYLPRLARGEEIPCFALTETEAGSDAAALRSEGTVVRREDGTLWMRVDWDKRYITLAPVATLIGLAFRLRDPDNLLGAGTEPGITCALIPSSLPGVEIGRHHDPMGVPFPNGPTRGRGVLLSVEQIIGGAAGAGRGWRMLMETLSAGRAISLPAQSVAGAKAIGRVVGAYAGVRRQFGLPLSRLAGVREPLARIAGFTYLMEAARVYTCGAVDAGVRPAVVSAIVKYQLTELLRRIVNDGMDVMAGAALCRGPRNLLARAYAAAPIGITVEGANILTRTLIIFGQGALRSHPWTRRELDALERQHGPALARALLGHAGSLLAALGRSALWSISRGRFARSAVAGPLGPFGRKLRWASSSFALLADLVILSQGSELKRRGQLTGRFADALSWLYLGLATIRRFEAEGRRPEDLPLARWGLRQSLAEVERALDGILANFPGRWIGSLIRGPVAAWSRLNRLSPPPADRLSAAAAEILCRPGEQRDRLTAGIYLPRETADPVRQLEDAFDLCHRSAPVRERILAAVRRGELAQADLERLIEPAVAAAVIDRSEGLLLLTAEESRRHVLQVDSFAREDYLDPTPRPPAGVHAGEPG